MSKLTPTQAKALDYIRSRIERSGVAPTLREICGHMGYSAIGSAQDVVAALKRKGFLQDGGRQAARSFIPTSHVRKAQPASNEGDANTLVIPCLGMVPAGNPLEAVEDQVGVLRMSIGMVPKPRVAGDKLFAVRAQGDSMIGAGILDGDWLVVKVQEEAPQDSIVVARIGEEATVKRLKRDRRRGWFLQPENNAYVAIYASEQPFQLVGQVIALQRVIN